MHSAFLQQTLDLALKRRGFCAPNPSVGAVVVKNGSIISTGYHMGAGFPHAEVEALRGLTDSDLKGATLYVSLEPCCHFGRTPPCTRLLIERGVERVVFAYADPDPRVSGKGRAELERAGIACEHAPLPEIDEFYASYKHWTQTGLPWVTAKLALTLDGKTSLRDGKPYPITADRLHDRTHRHRLQSDALLTTARTVLADNPRLNCRVDFEPVAKPIYVIDTRGEVPPNAKLFETAKKVTLFTAQDTPADPKNPSRLDLKAVLSAIGRDGVHDLWVEAGGTLLAGLANAGLLQRAELYVAPIWLGEEGAAAFKETPVWIEQAKSVRWENRGRDAICEVRW